MDVRWRRSRVMRMFKLIFLNKHIAPGAALLQKMFAPDSVGAPPPARLSLDEKDEGQRTKDKRIKAKEFAAWARLPQHDLCIKFIEMLWESRITSSIHAHRRLESVFGKKTNA